MTRHGSILADLGGALAGLGLLSAVVVGAAAEKRSLVADDHRAAALETAQNLLAAARRGAHLDAPSGWSSTRRALPGGVVEVRVRGPGIELATLVPALVPAEAP